MSPPVPVWHDFARPAPEQQPPVPQGPPPGPAQPNYTAPANPTPVGYPPAAGYDTPRDGMPAEGWPTPNGGGQFQTPSAFGAAGQSWPPEPAGAPGAVRGSFSGERGEDAPPRRGPGSDAPLIPTTKVPAVSTIPTTRIPAQSTGSSLPSSPAEADSSTGTSTGTSTGASTGTGTEDAALAQQPESASAEPDLAPPAASAENAAQVQPGGPPPQRAGRFQGRAQVPSHSQALPIVQAPETPVQSAPLWPEPAPRAEQSRPLDGYESQPPPAHHAAPPAPTEPAPAAQSPAAHAHAHAEAPAPAPAPWPLATHAPAAHDLAATPATQAPAPSAQAWPPAPPAPQPPSTAQASPAPTQDSARGTVYGGTALPAPPPTAHPYGHTGGYGVLTPLESTNGSLTGQIFGPRSPFALPPPEPEPERNSTRRVLIILGIVLTVMVGLGVAAGFFMQDLLAWMFSS